MCKMDEKQQIIVAKWVGKAVKRSEIVTQMKTY